MKDSYKKTIYKSISWRVIGTTTTAITIYILSGDVGISLVFGAVDSVIKTIAYFFHERFWNNVDES